MGEKILLLGGARSGKSSFAERLAGSANSRVLYVATAESGDEEMERRIAVHRAARPETWRTLEAPLRVGKSIKDCYGGEGFIILDCITVLVSNIVLMSSETPENLCIDAAEEAVSAEIDGLQSCMESLQAGFILVSNEVGLGLVPENSLGRAYRDILGRTNQRLASFCDTVYLMVAGIPVVVKQRTS